MRPAVVPGIYNHYLGCGTAHYRVLFTAIESTNAREGVDVVVYVSLTTGLVRVRTVAEFTEHVQWPDVFNLNRGEIEKGKIGPRFELALEPT